MSTICEAIKQRRVTIYRNGGDGRKGTKRVFTAEGAESVDRHAG